MSRTIKFRAFNKRLKQMFMVYSIDFDAGLVFCESEEDTRHTFGMIDVELLQLTGLQDKNGVDIYEGDVLNICFTSDSGEYAHDGVYVASIDKLRGINFRFHELLWVSYGYNQYPSRKDLNTSNDLGTIFVYSPNENRAFLYVSDQYATKVNGARDFPFNDEKELSFHSRYFEVIGDKYSNPELLEQSE